MAAAAVLATAAAAEVTGADVPAHAAPSDGLRVLLAGASGLIGRELLQALLADPQVAVVHSLGRRPLALEHPKLVQHVVDFAALPVLPAVDEALLASIVPQVDAVLDCSDNMLTRQRVNAACVADRKGEEDFVPFVGQALDAQFDRSRRCELTQ